MNKPIVQAYEIKKDITVGDITIFFSKKDDGWVLPGGAIEKKGGAVVAKINSMIKMSSNAAKVSGGV